MGLFDYINCEMPLPKTPVPPPTNEFQTKDTPDQYMTTYTITKDGKLTWRPYRMETVPESERPYPDTPFVGCLRRVESHPETIDFHGDICFGCAGITNGRFNGGDWEYLARFTNGVCEEIRLIEFSPPDAAMIAEIQGRTRP